jgi:hypothetical protein
MRSVPFELLESREGDLKVRFRDRLGIHKGKISAGGNDDVYVYREGTETYVLSMNRSLGYVGLQVWNENGEGFEDIIFLQYDYEVDEILGRNGIDKSPTWIARVLSNYQS